MMDIPTFQEKDLKVNIWKNWKENLKIKMFELSLESWNAGMRPQNIPRNFLKMARHQRSDTSAIATAA